MPSEITVSTFLQQQSDNLKLELVAGMEGLSRKIKNTEINRPGLAFSGYFEHFPAERVQIVGLGEYHFINSLPQEKVFEILNRIASFPDVPCFIITRNLEPRQELVQSCQEHRIPLMRTPLKASQVMSEVSNYLEDRMAPSTSIHGVLVDVYGLGVLLLGKAGIGKSECALELIKRGHMLVADDVVEIRLKSGGSLIGRGEEIIRHHMELRGVGIIDVRSLFGIGFILDESKIELVIKLEEWNQNQEYDRIGLEEHYTTILGTKIPEIVLPVGPGRNLAILVEIASLNQRLKNKGHYTAKELNQRLIQIMSQR